MHYCKAVLPRAGLGNRLLTWARCRVFSKRAGVPMLPTQWVQLRLGPLLRGESDTRLYGGLFVEPRQVGLARRMALRVVGKPLAEPKDWSTAGTQPDGIFVFEGFAPGFEALNVEREWLSAELRAITVRRWIEEAESAAPFSVGIHVRMGDFRPAKNAQELLHAGGLRTPFEWFRKTLALVRETLGHDCEAMVVSDGKEEDLKELLELPGVRLARTGSAIGDIWLLSRAKLLLASGGSSFSAWASFLGQMPTVSHPGQSLSWFKLTRRKEEWFLGELDPSKPDETFLEHVRELKGVLINPAKALPVRSCSLLKAS